MNIFTKLSRATAATLLLSGVGTMAPAQETLANLVTGSDPVAEAFERSNAACIEAKEKSSQVSCVYLTESMLEGGYTVADFAVDMNESPEKILDFNADFWESDVSPDTLIKPNKRFFFGVS